MYCCCVFTKFSSFCKIIFTVSFIYSSVFSLVFIQNHPISWWYLLSDVIVNRMKRWLMPRCALADCSSSSWFPLRSLQIPRQRRGSKARLRVGRHCLCLWSAQSDGLLWELPRVRRREVLLDGVLEGRRRGLGRRRSLICRKYSSNSSSCGSLKVEERDMFIFKRDQ